MMYRLLALIALLGTPAMAAVLDLPDTAQKISSRQTAFGTYDLPTGPYANGSVPSLPLEGAIDRQTWRLGAGSETVLQALDPLQRQLADAGYEPLFQCAAAECGGFEFRFGTEVVPAPDMFVALRDFQFLSTRSPSGSAISLLVSRVGTDTYLQVISVDTSPRSGQAAQGAPRSVSSEIVQQDLGQLLNRNGRAVLAGVDFASGSVALDTGDIESLKALSDLLLQDKAMKVGIVGHTDYVGSLQDNIDLSKRRAQAVTSFLVEQYGIPAARIQSEGMGYLAPLTTNLTPEGRKANRRIEVIMLEAGTE